MGDRETPVSAGSTALPSTVLSPGDAEAAAGIPESKRFDIVRTLGAGGMGVVFEAHDRQRDMRVAVKTLKRWSGALLLRFKNEFRALTDLHHRNLVQFHELFQEGPHWFFSMELVHGVDFLTYVRGDHARLAAALAELAEGLVALHRARKVHCDIKPSNVLVEAGGRVVLLDFGLVSETDDDGAPRQVGGTPAYMAPEQAAGRAVGPEADWYSVGVMLYQALTGELPRAPEPPAAGARGRDVPAALDALCLALLARDPAARPRGEEVLARLGRRAAPGPLEVPFVGRREELAELARAFARVREGRTVAVVLEGESGLGKSALAARFAESIGATGALVLAGRCYERESVPYKAFDGIIDALTHVLAGLPPAELRALLPADVALCVEAFPVLSSVPGLAALRDPSRGPPDPAERRHRLFTALRLLVTALARARGALVIVIDDLQWSDADSLALLAELARGSSILLVMTRRPGAPPELSCELRRLSLSRLAAGDAAELARELLAGAGGASAEGAGGLAEEAGGHPLYIAELVQHARGGGGGPRLSLDDALGARVGALDPARTALVELLAVAGGPLAQDALAQAAEQPSSAYSRHIAELRVAQLVRTDGERVDLYHDRVRAAVTRRLAAPALRAWHERLALTLEARPGTDREALLVHFRGAGQPLRAAEHAVVAADEAHAALAFARAARLYRTALELDPGRADAVRLEERLGDALAGLGHLAHAADAYLAAAQREPGGRALRFKRRAAELYLWVARNDRGQALLEEVLAAAGLRLARSPTRAVLTALWLRLRLALRGLDFTLRDERDVPPALLDALDACRSTTIGHMGTHLWTTFEFHSRGLLLALDAGEPLRLAEAISTEIGIAAILGPLGRGRVTRLLAIANQLADEVDRPFARARVVLAQAALAFYEGRWKESQARMERADRLFRDHCTGAQQELTIIALSTFCTRVFLGDLTEARRRLPELLAEAEERDEPIARAQFRMGFSCLVLLADGQLELARQRLAEVPRVLPPAPEGAPLLVGPRLFAGASIALYQAGGRGDEAWAVTRRLWKALVRSHDLQQKWLAVIFWELRGRAALAGAAAGGPAGARLSREVKRAARRCERQGIAWGAPFAAMLRAGLARLEGDAERARRLYEQAARGFADADMTMHEAVALRRLGSDRGDPWFAAQGVAEVDRFVAALAP